MAYRQVVGAKDGLEDVGLLHLPLHWRMDARNPQNRSLSERPWHDEELHVPLESIAVDSQEVLYRDDDLIRENSLKRIRRMLASRALPIAVAGGNAMRNVIDRLGSHETENMTGYGYSRVAIARRVLAYLHTEPASREEQYQSANLRIAFHYEPPQGEALKALADTLREKEG